MADRIKVSTEMLEKWARDLTSVQDGLSNAADILAGVNTEKGSGGELRISANETLHNGARISGENVAELVKSMRNALSTMEKETEKLSKKTLVAASLFSEAENYAYQLMRKTGIGESTQSVNQTGDNKGLYQIKSRYVDDLWKVYKEEWERQDKFINTDYNQRLMELLREKLMHDYRLSEEAWLKCDSKEKKEAFLRQAVALLQEIYGTSVNGVYFVYGESDETAIVMGKDGKEVAHRMSSNTNGIYCSDEDVIVIRIKDNKDYAELMNTLCHENRHNLQREIVETTNINDLIHDYHIQPIGTKGNNDYDSFVRSQSQWKHEMESYISTNDEDLLRQKRIEYDRNNSAIERAFHIAIGPNGPYIDYAEHRIQYAREELFYEYSKQQIEVDARYCGEFAEQCIREQRNNSVHTYYPQQDPTITRV